MEITHHRPKQFSICFPIQSQNREFKSLTYRSWYNVTKRYYYASSGVIRYAASSLSVSKTVTDNYSLGKVLTAGMVPMIIQNLIDSGSLREDPNGIYLVFTASDVSESVDTNYPFSFCEDYW